MLQTIFFSSNHHLSFNTKFLSQLCFPFLLIILFSGSNLFAQPWDIGGNVSTVNTDYKLQTLPTTGNAVSNIDIRVGITGPNIFLSNQGGIGMGTTAPIPNTGLTIEQNTGSVLILDQTSAANYHYGLKVLSNSNLTKSLAVQDASSQENFVVYSDGKVFARDVEVTLGVYNHPDYVFKKDYPLRPITDLKSYIAEHGHLPGIASAAEVSKKGSISVGETQRKLLEKIEELSLYVIQLNDALEMTQRKLAKLEADTQKGDQ